MSLSSEVAVTDQGGPDETSEPGVIAIVAVVDGIDDNGVSWTEIADVYSYGSNGVGFHVPRPFNVGNLISLRLQLPHHLRCYDLDEDLYQIWGLVQSCYMSITADRAAYQVVAALVGKSPPASYASDPLQDYRVCGSGEDGLWKITESDQPFVPRSEPRYWEQIDAYLALVDDRGSTTVGEKTRTQNVSNGGALVVTTLNLKVGDRVKLISEEFDFSGLAVVCNTESLKGSYLNVNLEFVESKFPVEKLKPKEAVS